MLTINNRRTENAVERNGVAIARTPGGIGVAWTSSPPPFHDRPITVEVMLSDGRRLKDYIFHPLNNLPFREYYGSGVDHLSLGIRVRDGDRLLAELPAPEAGPPLLPFMRLQGEQVHITESYVSVPPALTITDEVGAVWTLGFLRAQPEESPHGEFAFNVLRDGIDTGEIASRIERRAGKIRVFTRHGWKRWLGRSF